MESLIHRGPDGAGTWTDADAGVALGHRRLSILDISDAGRQPMVSRSGRYVISFNGEIYNHLEMRNELEDESDRPMWVGHSDTETLLAAFDSWGIEPALKLAVGMFALAVWDRCDRVLTLARDRIGEKPLYYGWQGGVFLFGSELKALREHPAFSADLDRESMRAFFRYGFIAAPLSIYRGVRKLLPGAYVQVTSGAYPQSELSPRRYWSMHDAVDGGLRNPFTGDDEEALEILERHLRKSISLQRIADVPVGAFLSGGIDSSTVVALMQMQANRPVETFTIGFEEQAYEEAHFARAVAQHLGTNHTELCVTPRDAMEIIPELPAIYDEPFGDSSAVPTFIVSKLARRHVTVCLSGDGGDELFAGYRRYSRANGAWRMMCKFPRPMRKTLSNAFDVISRLEQGSPLAWRAKRLALYLEAERFEDCYQLQLRQHSEPDRVLGETGEARKLPVYDPEIGSNTNDPWTLMMYKDALTYLPDDILVKIDRASMSVSLETRVPMLDHRVVEFAWRLPNELKIRNGEPKWLLKRLLAKYLPRSLVDRPKMGFGIPVSEWIRGPLKEWAEDLLSEQRLRSDGMLCARTVRKRWSQHLAGAVGEGDSLWQVLMFQAWLESSRAAPRARIV